MGAPQWRKLRREEEEEYTANVIYEHSDWSKYIFVANAYTANVIYCSPQLCIFIDPINTRFLHVFM